MRKPTIVGLGALVLTTLLSAGCAHDRTMRHGAMHGGAGMAGGMGPQAMDADKDGMISRDEFMNYHGAMYDRMPKNSGGTVSVAEMNKMMHHGAKSP